MTQLLNTTLHPLLVRMTRRGFGTQEIEDAILAGRPLAMSTFTDIAESILQYGKSWLDPYEPTYTVTCDGNPNGGLTTTTLTEDYEDAWGGVSERTTTATSGSNGADYTRYRVCTWPLSHNATYRQNSAALLDMVRDHSGAFDLAAFVARCQGLLDMMMVTSMSADCLVLHTMTRTGQTSAESYRDTFEWGYTPYEYNGTTYANGTTYERIETDTAVYMTASVRGLRNLWMGWSDGIDMDTYFVSADAIYCRVDNESSHTGYRYQYGTSSVGQALYRERSSTTTTRYSDGDIVHVSVAKSGAMSHSPPTVSHDLPPLSLPAGASNAYGIAWVQRRITYLPQCTIITFGNGF